MKVVIALEDTFGDIVKKAMRGTNQDLATLAAHTGVDEPRLLLFVDDHDTPGEEQARAIAKELKLDPGKLADVALSRWKPETRELPAEIGHQLNDPYPSNGYFVILEQARAAAFVDPGGNPRNIIETLQRSPVRVDYLLVTHKHRDHVDALGNVHRAFPSARVAVHRADRPALRDHGRDALEIADGDELPFGDGHIRVVHTPGHTDGSVCFIYRGSIFTGDTLFAGSVGGLFGDKFGYEDLLHGAATKIFTLPEQTVVLPGHGPPSTIAEERAHNPFFTY